VSVTDLGTFNQLADVAIDYVTLDSTLNLRRMVDLGRRFSSLGEGNLVFHSMPTERWITPGGADVQLVVPEEAESILAIFRGGETRPVTTVAPRRGPVTVLNGTTVEGQAALVADALGGAGFTVADTGNAGGTWATTTVRYGPGAADDAAWVARHLATGADLEGDDGLPEGAVILVVGSDFTLVRTTPLEPTADVLAGRPGFPTTTTTVASAVEGGSTTTTVAAPVGVVPGQPPEGVVCG
jgi:hypothetical protein